VLLLALPVVRLVRPFHPWPPRTPGPRWGRGAGARRVVELARKWNAESTGRFRSPAIGRPGGFGAVGGPTDDRRPAYLASAGTLSGLGITSRSPDGLPRP
jgi:hypothetical protein